MQGKDIPTMEDKRLHLQFIQSVIERMSKDSFIIKGWALTAFGGLFTVFIANQNKKWSYNLLFLALICSLVFWWHDAYYLRIERQYRNLYNIVIKKSPSEIDYSMTPPNTEEHFLCVAFRPILACSYGIITLFSIILLYILK
ncbi:hypothetical protein IBB3154_08 (plasmid) [Ligilactobacillus salivarius]|uniref:hypothetical protein n=1 Tax=Ligilactobacillus salivarius TaxID=1624 RepID=UPI0013DE263F|nr:hypothetical protein [Ligilactobacillus salivarius]QIG37558.1 hypothetical protein IBB3154_08 [Ligilactobacillus salivarius]